MFQKIITQISILVLIIGSIFLANGLILAWNTPTAVAPGNNIATPLNISATGQSKAGGLIVNTGGAEVGLIVDQGEMGIGSDSSNIKLEIAGGIRLGDTDLVVGGLIKYAPIFHDFCGYNGSSWVSLTGNSSCQITYSWQTSSWGDCSVPCEGGTQTRDVWCQRQDGTNMGSDCDIYSGCECVTKPVTSQECNTQPCYTYSYTGWSCGSCSVSCGGGIITCTRSCQRSDGASVDCSYCGGYCSYTESCNTQSCTYCGDGSCNGGETVSSCPADCCVNECSFYGAGRCNGNNVEQCEYDSYGCLKWFFRTNCSPNYCQQQGINAFCVMCLIPGTKVIMADNTLKNIEDIETGERVLGYENGQKIINEVYGVIREHIREGYYMVTLRDGTELKITNDHPIYARDEKGKGWKAVDSQAGSFVYETDVGELNIGDDVLNNYKKWIVVTDIDYVEGRVLTYTLVFEQKEKNFFANGVLVSGIGKDY
ncbi:MAG: thrombospondin type-1 domain-containing protein [Patescibacteria group bacterium]